MIPRALALLLVAAALSAGTAASGADFVATSATPGNTFTTAADFNTVTATLADPGSPLHGSATLSADASSHRGIASVRIQAAPTGTQTWTDLCTVTSAPYSCRWDSTTLAGGTYDLRALATDAAGYSRASATVAARVVDNAGPDVTLADPGVLTGTTTISASADDTGTGVADLTIEYRRPGDQAWTRLCGGSAASQSCPLDTSAMGDGDLELHAVATDAVGNTRNSPTRTRLIDNTVPTVASTDPGELVHGRAGVTVTAGDTGSGIASVTVQIRPQGTSTWMTACTLYTPPYTCSGDTHVLPDGMWEVRAIATDKGGLQTIAATGVSRVDNTAPATVTLGDPGTVVTGSVPLTGTAADAGSDGGSGVGSWRVEYAPTGTGTWQTACTATTSPYACDWSSAKAPDGVYDLRAVAIDRAGNTAYSAKRTGIRVDNAGPTVTFAAPAAPVRGAVSLSATASDLSGVTSLTFERGSDSICTFAASPYACTWDTTAVADGYYLIRARAVDGRGNEGSTTQQFQVDNTPPTPQDVQAGNGGGTAGLMEDGDWLRLTWSEPIAPASVLTGWDGGSQAVTVRVGDGGPNDTVSLLNAAATAPLHLASALSLGADVVDGTTDWDATMIRSGASITITLGSRGSGAVKPASAGTMTWTASTAATDPAGNASAAGPVTESGAADKDF